MADTAPEIHVKALLESADRMGASADAALQRAEQLAQSSTPQAPPVDAKPPAAPTK